MLRQNCSQRCRQATWTYWQEPRHWQGRTSLPSSGPHLQIRHSTTVFAESSLSSLTLTFTKDGTPGAFDGYMRVTWCAESCCRRAALEKYFRHESGEKGTEVRLCLTPNEPPHRKTFSRDQGLLLCFHASFLTQDAPSSLQEGSPRFLGPEFALAADTA